MATKPVIELGDWQIRKDNIYKYLVHLCNYNRYSCLTSHVFQDDRVQAEAAVVHDYLEGYRCGKCKKRPSKQLLLMYRILNNGN